MKGKLKVLCLLLVTLLLSLSLMTGCGGAPEAEDQPSQPAAETEQAYDDGAEDEEVSKAPAIDEDGVYTSKEDVALYLYTYRKLPQNFITKKKAKELGWDGGSLDRYAPGKCIGGDYFGNYEGILPEDVSYRECDIDTLGKKKRGAKRIIYSEDWKIYYTEDHYETFERLY
ncbi:MAG: ribonuclease [Firmicutes bacterium]|nr:ribonuclease [Bacillota bacterium]